MPKKKHTLPPIKQQGERGDGSQVSEETTSEASSYETTYTEESEVGEGCYESQVSEETTTEAPPCETTETEESDSTTEWE